MATKVDIIGFHKGEAVSITLLAKEPDGTVLANAASTVITMRIGTSVGGDADLIFSTTEGSITLTDGPTAEFAILLTPTGLTNAIEGKLYKHNIWSGTGATSLLQAKGAFLLQQSMES
jgi:hypothetical protein